MDCEFTMPNFHLEPSLVPGFPTFSGPENDVESECVRVGRVQMTGIRCSRISQRGLGKDKEHTIVCVDDYPLPDWWGLLCILLHLSEVR